MREKSLYVLLVCIMLLPCIAEAQGFLFDFGPGDSIPAEGFSRVDETSAYCSDEGYGWVSPVDLYARNENFSAQTVSLDLPSPLSTHVTGGKDWNYPGSRYTFRLDLPDGEYRALLVMGKITERNGHLLNRPSFFYTGHGVAANGVPVVEVERNWSTHLSDHFSRNESDFLSGDSIYDKYVSPYFDFHYFEFSSEGSLTLEIDSVCPVNALLVFPAGDLSAKKSAVDAFVDSNREYVDGLFKLIYEEEPMDESLRAELMSEGAVLFSRASASGIFPGSRPNRSEAWSPAKDFMARGQTGLFQVFFLPFKDMREVKVSVSGLLSERGDTIPREDISIWLGRYIYKPLARGASSGEIKLWYYLKYKPMDMVPGVARVFNVYVDTDAKTPPGIYRGEFRVECAAGGGEYSLPLAAKVLPFELDPPDILFGQYSYHPTMSELRFAPGGGLDREVLRQTSKKMEFEHLKQMKNVGFNTAALTTPWRPFNISEEGDITVNEEVWDLWKNSMDVYQEIFGDSPIPIFGMGWSVIASAVPGFSFSNYHEGYELPGHVKENMRKLIEHFYARARDKGWPEVIFYTSDELSNQGRRGAEWGRLIARMYGEISEQVGFRTMASMNGPFEQIIVPYVDIAVPNFDFPITEETVGGIRDAGTDLWFYNVGDNRFSFGFYLTAARPGARLQWMNIAVSDGHRQVQNIPSLDPLGWTSIWDSKLKLARRADVEDVRQGITDYLYYITLERLISENELAEGALGRAVSRGRAVLERISGNVQLDARRYKPWDSETCGTLRWMLADAIRGVLHAEE